MPLTSAPPQQPRPALALTLALALILALALEYPLPYPQPPFLTLNPGTPLDVYIETLPTKGDLYRTNDGAGLRFQPEP